MKCPRCDGTGDGWLSGNDCYKCDGTGSVPLQEWWDWKYITLLEWKNTIRQRFRRPAPFWYIECPECDGYGSWTEPVLHGGIGGGPTYECHLCEGQCYISPLTLLWWKYWVTEPPALVWKIRQLQIWWETGDWVR